MSTNTLRLRITRTIALCGFIALALRAVQLTVVQAPGLHARATRQHQQEVRLPAKRGTIADRNGNFLALTRESAAVYVRPGQLNIEHGALQTVAGALNLPLDFVTVKATSTAPFVYLDRQVPLERWSALEELRLPGIGSEPARQRFYPFGSLAGQVLGFTGIDGQGLEGIELQLDAVLRGEVDTLDVERDARGRRMVVDDGWRPLPRVGAQVELTIDAGLQHVVESELAQTVTEFQADGAIAVVLTPDTGEVLAMANVPHVDPNDVGSASAALRRNRAITDFYEPGSTFKAVLAAAALDAGVIKPDDRIHCEHGNYPIGRRVIHDHHAYGTLSFTEVIEFSSNIGCTKVAERLGAERYGKAIADFGFGTRTGIDLPGESPGNVRPAERWGHIHLATVSFGQGIAVTPLQLTRAFAAIANGGLLMRPYVVRRIVDQNGTPQYVGGPRVERRVVSPETAATLTEILRGVVEKGTGKAAHIDGLAVAGKTGTAQKVDENGRYSKRARISSFVGYVPADNPRMVILVMVDTPRKATYGGTVAAPTFRRIAEYGLDRLDVRPAVQEPSEVKLVLAKAPNADAPVLVGVPSFLGLSMRDALVQAQRLGWEVRVDGSGYVVAQDPPPGGMLRSPELALTLASTVP